MNKLLSAIALSAVLVGSLGRASDASPLPASGSAAPEFLVDGQWFNSKPLTVASLRGKVVLVNIWVFSCINCHRSLPTLQDWYRTYKDQGLEIVGPHTPEFESDKPAENVKAALERDGVTWPVFQDNLNRTWNAYSTRAWPSFILIDRQGRVRAVHAGEMSTTFPNNIRPFEEKIKALLAESAP